MNKNTIIVIILGVLVLVSIVQAFQLNSLKTKLTGNALFSGKGNSVNTASQNTAAASQTSGHKQAASVPNSLENLPSMVGGC